MQTAQCERKPTQTAQALFSAPFRLGRDSLLGEYKGFEVLNGPGAMLSLILVLILLVFAVKCESHHRRAPKSVCLCVYLGELVVVLLLLLHLLCVQTMTGPR